MKSHIATVDPIAIVKLLGRFADSHPAEIEIQVRLRTDGLVELGPPHRNLHLVVRVVNARVKDIYFSRFSVGSDVAVPQVTMDQGRPHDPSIGFQWPENFWDHVCNQTLEDVFQILPGSVPLPVQLHCTFEQLNVKVHPAWVPCRLLREIALAGIDVEAEMAGRRFARLMHLNEFGAELSWIWTSIRHLDKVAKEIICVGIGDVEFLPRVRLWNECWRRFVQFAHGVEFPFQHGLSLGTFGTLLCNQLGTEKSSVGLLP